MKLLSTMKYIISSSSARNAVKAIYDNIFDVFSCDPLAAVDLIKNIKNFPSTMRDRIFFECLETYILNLNEYDNDGKTFVEDNLKNMADSLTEISPNNEDDYEGDPTKLREYSKRIVKLIDDCGTIQKAIYLANISRVFVKHQIDKRLFFKLAQCIRMLTEEDLLFLSENVTEGTLSSIDYVDDFRGLGLMYEVDGGFAYSKKAFQLLKFALNYESIDYIPEIYPKRNVLSVMTKDDIEAIINTNIDQVNN